MSWRIVLLALLCSVVANLRAVAPAEITVTSATKLEIVRDGRVTGSVGLGAGTKVELVEVSGEFAVVRYRNITGRVPLARTDLPAQPAGNAASASTASSGPTASKSQTAAAAPAGEPATPKPPYAPSSPIERALAGKLVQLTGGSVRPQDASRLAGVKFFGIYFSASWCGPCRQFTPELIDAYGKIRSMYPEFEVVLVSRDQSASEMDGYIRSDRMPWPALAWNAIRGHEVNRYAGNGIPCLVLVDENGKVLSDSYRWGRYVGPDAVVDDTWKILRDYRRGHPRPKS